MGSDSDSIATTIALSSFVGSLAPSPKSPNPPFQLPPPPKCAHFGVAIICALPLEATAVRALFEREWDHSKLDRANGDTNTYSVGAIGPHRVVLVYMPGMGKVSAATTAAKLRSSFVNLKLVLLVGICGGAPGSSQKKSDELLLGDVVVSTGVVQYDLGRRFPGKFVRKDTVHENLSPLSPLAKPVLAKLQTKQGKDDLESSVFAHLQRLQQRLGAAATFPGRARDRLFRPDYLHKHHDSSSCTTCAAGHGAVCNEALEKSCDILGCGRDDSALVARLRPEESCQPVVHFGLYASGDTVMRSGKDRDDIARRDNVIAFEMEGAGMWEELRSCACLIVKSVCDYADSHKNKTWQAYAAAAAAATARGLLEHWDTYNPSSPRSQPALTARDIRLLSKLKTLDYRDRKDRNPPRVIGTCEWFVGHSLFRAWLQSSDPNTRALWVSADPGCGKSVLAKHLIDDVLTATETRTTCYFFFKDDFADQKSLTSAVSCVLHQLFIQRPSLLSNEVRARLDAEGDKLVASFHDLWDVLIEVAEADYGGEIICVFDALDECNTGDRKQLAGMLHHLYHTQRAPNLKFLLTSRPYRDIRRDLQLLDGSELAVVHLSGENADEVEKISREIDIFIKARVNGIAARQRLVSEEKDLLLHGLLNIPHRTYLWVYLTLTMVESEEDLNGDKIIQVTSHLPRSVDESYNRILSKSPRPEEAKRTLQIILAAERPLTLQEMNFALAFQPSHRSYREVSLVPNERFEERLRDTCGLFVTVAESKVYLLHQTTREFLLKSDMGQENHEDPGSHLEWRYSLELPECHLILGKICLWHLQFPELDKQMDGHIFQLGDPLRDYTFLKYSAMFWAVHFRAQNVRIDKNTMRLILQTCHSMLQRRPFWFRAAVAEQADIVPGQPFNPAICDDPAATPLILASYLGLAPIAKHLLERGGADARAQDSHGRTALAWAAAHDHYDVAKVLLDGRASLFNGFGMFFPAKKTLIDARDASGRTPLMEAIVGYSERVASLLLDQGADLEAREFHTGETALWKAVARSRATTRLVKLLLERGANAESRGGPDEATPLIMASRHATDATLQLLLQHGVDIEAICYEDGTTALMEAIEYYCEANARFLIENGARINAQDDRGQTPFSLACARGRLKTARLLLEKGADIESKEQAGKSALALACLGKHEKLAQFLLDNGADVNSRCNAGRTPLFYAWGYGHTDRKRFPTVAQLLLDRGADLEARDNHGASVLSAVAWYGNRDGVRWLIQNGADVESQDDNGRTPLVAAVALPDGALSVPIGLQPDRSKKWRTVNPATVFPKSPNVFKELLDHGANIEHRDHSGRTALSYAAGPGPTSKLEIVKLLLERGADVHAADDGGRTPLFWATDKKVDTAVVKALIEAGADVNMRDRKGRTPLVLACGEGGNPQTAELLRELGVTMEEQGVGAPAEHEREELLEIARTETGTTVSLPRRRMSIAAQQSQASYPRIKEDTRNTILRHYRSSTVYIR
ncbi:hypothetical protein VTI74DRAFT_10609 [Chaetomium olivicolor]